MDANQVEGREDSGLLELVWDDVLAWVVSGECAPDAPEVAEWVGGRADREAALVGAIELARTLDHVGQLEREMAARTPTPGRVLTALRRWWPWMWRLGVLSVVLIALAGAFFSS